MLLVDDDFGLLRVVQRLLEKHGHQVSAASDIGSALYKARKVQPRAILLDVYLGYENGLTAVGALKQASPGAAIVVLTSDVDLIHDAARAGVHAFLPKDALSRAPHVIEYVAHQLASRRQHL